MPKPAPAARLVDARRHLREAIAALSPAPFDAFAALIGVAAHEHGFFGAAWSPELARVGLALEHYLDVVDTTDDDTPPGNTRN